MAGWLCLLPRQILAPYCRATDERSRRERHCADRPVVAIWPKAAIRPWTPFTPWNAGRRDGAVIPSGAAIRVVGDVHGDAQGFAIAAATDRFVVQLGDLTDHGPDSAGALDIAFRLLDDGRGMF